MNSLGHAHPVFVEAVTEPGATCARLELLRDPPQLELAERLKRLTGAGDAGRVYFGNSGAEANEAAFKLARRTWPRPRILALNDSFHGRTMGTLALTGKAALREPFQPLMPGVDIIDTTIEALEAAIGPDVAALFVEPIKGEAGVRRFPRATSTPRANSRRNTARCSSSTRSRPAPDAPGAGSASSRAASFPTRSPSRRASAAASRSARS